MKFVLFVISISLFCFQLSFAQSLPFNFENTAANPSFIDFDGGVATIVANPSASGINTSSTVARIIRNGGAVWGGSKVVLAANLSFAINTKISMKVYTTAPVGTIVKMKLEGTGPAVDVNATTTTSGAWETLEWIFAGTPNNLNEIVFMFDFGNVGNGSANSTFYFDDVAQVPGPTAPTLASLPINFESGYAASDFLNFSGAITTIVANPVKTGINTSDTVAQLIRYGGDIWAGSKILLANELNFSTMWYISMKVYTTAPVGTRIKLQLEEPTGMESLDVLTTVSGAWETLTWSFYGQPTRFNRIAFLFDFGKVGNGSATSTFLFDDIQQVAGPAPTPPVPAAMPVNFESSVQTSDFTNQFGAYATIVANPAPSGINTSATVAQFLKSGGQVWARSLLQLTNYLNFSNLSAISMKVYTDAPVGSILKLKVESTTTGAANEKDVLSTVSGAWATYTWDFAGDPPVYNVLTFMFGYGVVGNASSSSTFYIDDIIQTNADGTVSIPNLDEDHQVRIFPNPAKAQLNVRSGAKIMQSIALYTIDGKQVLVDWPQSNEAQLNIAHLPAGLYVASIRTASGEQRIKLAVE